MDDERILELLNSKSLDSKIIKNIITCVIDKRVENILENRTIEIVEKLVDNGLKENITINNKKYSSLNEYINKKYKEIIKTINLTKLVKQSISEKIIEDIEYQDY